VRKSNLLLIISALSIGLIAFAPAMSAYNDGATNGNHDLNSCGCHTTESACTIAMSASKTTLIPGETVTVTVNVTSSETVDDLIGVMILSDIDNDLKPYDEGWTITSDPDGLPNNYSYYENTSTGNDASFTWTLAAPIAEGSYTLYAREYHGDPGAVIRYYKDDTTGIAFTVAIPEPGDTGLTVYFTSPANGATVTDNFTVAATITPEGNVSYAVLKMDGEEIGNKSTGPFSWTINPADYDNGTYVLNLTAEDITGNRSYAEITITVDNTVDDTNGDNGNGKDEDEIRRDWVATLLAGSIAIITIGAAMILAALFVRRMADRKKGGGQQ